MRCALTAHVDREEALGYLGWAGQELDADLAARLDRAVDLVERITPTGLAQVFRVDSISCDAAGVPCAVHLAGTPLVLESRDLAAHLGRPCEVVLMAVTLGLESERVLRRAGVRSAVDGLLVDACASSFVESAANDLSRRIAEDAAARGLRAGARFSPGYGDLPLEVQPRFIAALDAGKLIGLSVTAGNLLVPTKSITAVAGLYDAPGDAIGDSASDAPAPDGSLVPKATERRCATCRLADSCLLRKQGRTCYESR